MECYAAHKGATLSSFLEYYYQPSCLHNHLDELAEGFLDKQC